MVRRFSKPRRHYPNEREPQTHGGTEKGLARRAMRRSHSHFLREKLGAGDSLFSALCVCGSMAERLRVWSDERLTWARGFSPRNLPTNKIFLPQFRGWVRVIPQGSISLRNRAARSRSGTDGIYQGKLWAPFEIAHELMQGLILRPLLTSPTLSRQRSPRVRRMNFRPAPSGAT